MQKKFHYNNVNIFYRTEGEGMPVVLLHGIPLDGSVWDEQIDFLKDYCKLIVPDIPGSGKSTFEKQEEQATTIEYYASCIYALLQHENVNTCLMLGHSMGGYITLAFAEKYLSLLKGFGLIHSTAFADNEERKQRRKKSIETIEQSGSSVFLKDFIPNLFGKKFKSDHPEKIRTLIEKGNIFSKQALEDYFLAMMKRPDRTAILKNSKLPVLLVIGTEDTAAPIKDVLQQAHLSEITYVHILEECGHIGMWEATANLNNAILEFIKDIIRNE
ncbi:MAG TPA: alpha/beta hydrolase [Chitinophagaceae bacterium]|jgi:pimeloyl-ACP methyl ester carboxylesterase